VSGSAHCSHLQVAVLALGDQAYPHFCRAGKQLHALLQYVRGSTRTDVELSRRE